MKLNSNMFLINPAEGNVAVTVNVEGVEVVAVITPNMALTIVSRFIEAVQEATAPKVELTHPWGPV